MDGKGPQHHEARGNTGAVLLGCTEEKDNAVSRCGIDERKKGTRKPELRNEEEMAYTIGLLVVAGGLGKVYKQVASTNVEDSRRRLVLRKDTKPAHRNREMCLV